MTHSEWKNWYLQHRYQAIIKIQRWKQRWFVWPFSHMWMNNPLMGGKRKTSRFWQVFQLLVNSKDSTQTVQFGAIHLHRTVGWLSRHVVQSKTLCKLWLYFHVNLLPFEKLKGVVSSIAEKCKGSFWSTIPEKLEGLSEILRFLLLQYETVLFRKRYDSY